MEQNTTVVAIPADDTPIPPSHVLLDTALSFESLLPEVLAMVRDPWTRDFLFKMNASADVAALTSPAQLRYGMITDSTVSMFDTTMAYNGIFDMDVDARWLTVPVFCIGGITAEIIVQTEESIKNTNLCAARGTTTIIRMLRSDVTGDLLIVLDDEKEGDISFSYFHTESSTLRKRVFLRGKRDMVLEAVLGSTNTDFGKLLRSLTIANEAHETHRCPLCWSAPEAKCGCRFSLSRPSHPMDFSFCRTNMICHSGHFSGTSVMSFLSNGVPFAKGAVSCTVGINICMELGSLRELAAVGIRLRMHSNLVVPRSCLTPFLFEEGVEASGAPERRGTLEIVSDFCPLKETTEVSLEAPPTHLSTVTVAHSGEPLVAHGLQWLPDVEPVEVGNTDLRSIDNPVSVLETSLPCNVTPSVVAAAKKIVMEEDARAKEAEARKLRRQIKNRESAARSNLRRKQRNDSMKQSLARLRERKCQLQQRETELKLENASLRKVVGGDH